MSALGNAFGALKQVLLMETRLDQLDRRLTRMSSDIDGLVDAVAALRDRVSRLEGIIEGAAMASRQRRIEE